MEGGDALEDRVSQRLLEVVAPCSSELGHLGAEKVVVPRFRGIIVGWRSKIVEPDLDADQQPLWRTNLEVVEADIGLNLKALKHDSLRTNAKVRWNKAAEPWRARSSLRAQELDVALQRHEALAGVDA